MSGGVYREIAPPPTLAPFVRTLWTYADATPSGEVQRIAPDGCPELIVHRAAPYQELGEDGVWRLQPSAVFAGQLTRPLALRPSGPVDLLAVRFRPDGARDCIGRPLIQVTDRRLDWTDQGLPEDIQAVVAVLDARRVSDGWRIDAEVRAAVEGAHGPADPAGRRTLQRRFRDRVGVSLQTLRSIQRFRSVFDHAASSDDRSGDWLSAGLEAGYFDQPQLARDFRRFLGCTATAWAREQVELARAIASSSYKTQARTEL